MKRKPPTFLERTLRKFGLARIKRTQSIQQKRSFHAGVLNRLTSDWNPAQATADAATADTLPLARERSRELVMRSSYARRFLNATENNVLGYQGVSLQMRVMDEKMEGGKLVKVPDRKANELIESAWKRWCKKKNCTVTGEDSWVDVQKLVLRSTATDGAKLIRKRKDKNLNEFGFALQLYEVDHIDRNYSAVLPNGNTVRFGIEKNAWGKTVAFHLLNRHPGDHLGYGRGPQYRERVEASEFIYYFIKERSTQTEGWPWMQASMPKIHHLDRYEEAEERAARAASEKGGYFTTEGGQTFTGPTEDGEPAGTTEASNNILNDFEPSSFDQLPQGVKFQPYDIQHPNSAYGDFVRSCLYGIAAGMNIDYSTLTGDLSQANYSSMRSGKLETQEAWKAIQRHFIENFCEEVFTAWLEMAILSGQVPLPMAKFDKFNAPNFRGRRWPWVDPSKDIDAALKAIDGGLGTRTDYLSDNNVGDLEEVFDKLGEEKREAEERGLVFATAATKPETPEQPDETISEIEQVKALADAYGVGVRAGTITPNDEDEAFFRERLQLPAANKNVAKAWSEDEGIRRPITLVQKADGVAVAPGAKPKADGESEQKPLEE